MKSRVRKSGYVTVSLHKDKNNVHKDFFIHKLVLISFVDNPENKKEGNHKKGIKTDNRLTELEWCTR
ncbi:hypothetical protein M3M33_17195, partial [Loigolactobacillus coryniformis]|nr:hypothetical protein [Loigolactobacillus coryniformis]